MHSDQQTSLLLVEDDEELSLLYQTYLKDENYHLSHVSKGIDALRLLREQTPDIALIDLELPDMSGLDILQTLQQEGLSVSVIIISAHGSIEEAVKAIQYKALDFLEKPFSQRRLLVTLRNAAQHQHLRRLVKFYQQSERSEYYGFIGASLPMQGIYRIIESVASSKATVFITGESGTGKELCAAAIHRQSPRKDKAFITLNCAAIPTELMESEIFGHVKGAFTGALKERQGAARLANGGTLFLDEIGDMDLQLQSKLLRFVQMGSFQKVGGSRQEQVDVRFICATNRNPLHEVKAGRFREDLYYRLHVLPIHLPPLRRRDSDIILIARAFLQKYTAEENKSFTRFSAEVEAIFMQHDWPGNVRELQNAVRHAVVLNQGEEILAEMLLPPLNTLIQDIPTNSAMQTVEIQPVSQQNIETVADESSAEQKITPLHDIERHAIENAIELCQGNVTQAAQELGVNASTIYRKMRLWDKSA